MRFLKIAKDDWTRGVEDLKKSFRVFGPVKEKEAYDFRLLDKGVLPDFSFQNTRLSPKSTVYPQSEILFEYTLDESKADHHVHKVPEKDYSPRVILGIRPCDAKAFELVRLNFDTPEYKDPYWLSAYEATTKVGLACDDPCSTCFCTSAGSGPYDEAGLDVLLADRDDHFLAKVLTEKGEAFVSAAGWNTEAPDAEAGFEKLAAEAEGKVPGGVPTDKLADKETVALHGADFWEDVAFSCINCGTCTYLCPTCWCFDIQDEVKGAEGVRMRNWDSCMFPLFTLHGSGHNPRATKVDRVRQRFMHKLKYFVDRYGRGIQCVGCGRCVSSCPVNIDIRRVARLMNEFEPAPEKCPA
ncbi:MAG: 4Fe-4S dicluster domain-containing protein [Deltaproteobacteria bacterium]|nr:4Fe-4S dicluster domain-containing protein [Deltaproteobacteria bacterium]